MVPPAPSCPTAPHTGGRQYQRRRLSKDVPARTRASECGVWTGAGGGLGFGGGICNRQFTYRVKTADDVFKASRG
eukprot:327337-Chlamydomonas_euryale.AAC.1